MATSRADGSPYQKLPFDAAKLEAVVPGVADIPLNTLYQIELPDKSVLELVRVAAWPEPPLKESAPASKG